MKSPTPHTNSLLTLMVKMFGQLRKVPLLPILIDEQLKLFTFIFRPKQFLRMRELRRMVEERLRLDCCYHRFGGLEFRFEGKEVAHLHSDGLLDIRYPRRLAQHLIEKRVTGPHHVNPASGWTSLLIQSDTDVESSVQLIECKLQLQKGELDVNAAIEKF